MHFCYLRHKENTKAFWCVLTGFSSPSPFPSHTLIYSPSNSRTAVDWFTALNIEVVSISSPMFSHFLRGTPTGSPTTARLPAAGDELAAAKTRLWWKTKNWRKRRKSNNNEDDSDDSYNSNNENNNNDMNNRNSKWYWK